MQKSQLKSTDHEDYTKLKAIKYPVRPISNAIILDKKLKSFSPSIQTTLKKYISKELNAYRQVRGDGNCFFRAFAFTCIASKKRQQLEDIFPLLEKIKLDSCKPASIPPAFRPLYEDKRLKAVLKKRWDVDFNFFLRNNGFNYKRALSRMFNENHYLDFIVVLYFRAVCLWVLQTQERYRQYLSTEAEQITTYGCQSEGVTINLCSGYFYMNIRILEVRANEVIPYDYMVIKNTFVGQENKVDLLYSDAHYDLIQKNDDPLAEYEDEKMEEEYYSEIRYNYTKGTCLECQKTAQISQETGLCQNCFNKSRQNFNSFQKDSQIQGQCSQCARNTKISQDLLMCEDCLQQLQYASNNNSRIREAPPQSFQDYFKKKKCRECKQDKKFSEMNHEEDLCHDCRRRIEEESNTSPSSIPSLHNKLQSKITRERKEEEKKVTQAMIRSKTKLITFFCKDCKKDFQVASEEQPQKSGQRCPECAKKRSQIKASSQIRPIEGIRQSGLERLPFASQIKGWKTSGKPTCIKCGNSSSFPLNNGFCKKCKKCKN